MAPTTRRVLRLAERPHNATEEIDWSPDAEARAEIARALDVPEVRKLRLTGTLSPEGKRDWRLDATLGATVVQACVVTLAPVTTRIDESLTRRFLARMPDPGPGEVEMPEDTDVEPLPETIDLGALAVEALELALPPYPRADGAEAGEMVFAEPGTTPMTDEDVRPFAGLAGLRDSLKPDEDGEG